MKNRFVIDETPYVLPSHMKTLKLKEHLWKYINGLFQNHTDRLKRWEGQKREEGKKTDQFICDVSNLFLHFKTFFERIADKEDSNNIKTGLSIHQKEFKAVLESCEVNVIDPLDNPTDKNILKNVEVKTNIPHPDVKEDTVCKSYRPIVYHNGDLLCSGMVDLYIPPDEQNKGES